MYYQNDPKWKNIPLNNSEMTIGEVGCLLTSLCNSAYLRHPSIKITPDELNKELTNSKGYTENNLIIWAVASRLLGAEIDHNYKGQIEYDSNSFYIVNFLNFGVGHFTNLIKKECEKYYIYDVWDDKFKVIDKPRRLVKVTFK